VSGGWVGGWGLWSRGGLYCNLMTRKPGARFITRRVPRYKNTRRSEHSRCRRSMRYL